MAPAQSTLSSWASGKVLSSTTRAFYGLTIDHKFVLPRPRRADVAVFLEPRDDTLQLWGCRLEFDGVDGHCFAGVIGDGRKQLLAQLLQFVRTAALGLHARLLCRHRYQR